MSVERASYGLIIIFLLLWIGLYLSNLHRNENGQAEMPATAVQVVQMRQEGNLLWVQTLNHSPYTFSTMTASVEFTPEGEPQRVIDVNSDTQESVAPGDSTWFTIPLRSQGADVFLVRWRLREITAYAQGHGYYVRLRGQEVPLQYTEIPGYNYGG